MKANKALKRLTKIEALNVEGEGPIFSKCAQA